MHIYFSGIGGTGIGPLALIAKQAGYEVSGSDASNSQYIGYLRDKGLENIHIGQSTRQISEVNEKRPIDWFVYSSALPPTHEELVFCQKNNIKTSKRDELLNQILVDKKLKLIAVSGTHGKTTTTAMAIWLFKQLAIPVSYSVGAKLSFGEMGEFDASGEYFIYEADEFDRNFLAFKPYMSLITGLDWDHPDIYPSRELYNQAFRQFLDQSQTAFIWQDDLEALNYHAENLIIADETEPDIDLELSLPGLVNRKDAWLVALAAHRLSGVAMDDLLGHLNQFPGVSRRFEEIALNLYSDYAHTPPKIRGALQLAHEIAGDNVVVIYEGLHNTRQHFIKQDLENLFNSVKQLYIVPSYLARENDNLPLLTPANLLSLLSDKAKAHAQASELNGELEKAIKAHTSGGDLVLALSAGGGNSLDEWLRDKFAG
jgi:UDP-N-acetylmuramate--alanine ligase